MRMVTIAAALALPVGMAACSRPEPPAPPPVPVVSPGEAACAGLAAQESGMEVASVDVTPASSTKTGATVYLATVGGVDYTCVVEIDGSVSSFGT